MFLNRCIWTPVAGGLADFVVSAAAQNGYTPAQCIDPVVFNGGTYHYFATNGTDHEEGDGVYTTASATLTRATIRNSSNAGAKVNFSSAPTVTMGGPISSDILPLVFSPLSIQGLGLWLDASAIGLNDGDTVSTWIDQSGNGNDATATGTPIYRATVMNARPGVEFITAGRHFTTPTFLDSSYNTSFSAYVVAKNAATTLKVMFSNNDTLLYFGQTSTVDVVLSSSNIGGGSLNTVGTFGNAQAMSGRYDGAKVTLAMSDTTQQFQSITAAAGNMALTGALTVGDIPSGGFTWTGQICELLMFNRTLTDFEESLIFNYFKTKYAIHFSPNFFICSGNSLTAGTGAAGPYGYYPNQTRILLGASSWDVSNLGHPGDTTADLIAAIGSDGIAGLLDKRRTKNIAVLWEITNDLATNVDPTGAYNRVVTWCGDISALGYKVVIVTCLPRGADATFETNRQTVNANIRTNWPTFADALADVGNDPTIGQNGDQNNSTYYNVDTIHLTNAGYTIVAGIVSRAIQSL